MIKLTSQNLTEVTIALLKVLKVPLTRTSIINELQNHPESYSLLAITHLLTKFNVNNMIAKLKLEDLPDISTPSLTTLYFK